MPPSHTTPPDVTRSSPLAEPMTRGSSTCVRRGPSQPRTCSPVRSRSALPILRQIAWSQAAVLLSVCHSNATRLKEVLGFTFEKRSQPGAPLRNRTVDLLLTMDRSAVAQPQVDRLTCENTSTRWHSQAPDEPTQAPFATQSATQIDLAAPKLARSARYRRSAILEEWIRNRPPREPCYARHASRLACPRWTWPAGRVSRRA